MNVKLLKRLGAARQMAAKAKDQATAHAIDHAISVHLRRPESERDYHLGCLEEHINI